MLWWGRMAAAITHEINNPLDTVTNLLFLIEGLPLGQESRNYLKTAQEELQRISRITRQTPRLLPAKHLFAKA